MLPWEILDAYGEHLAMSLVLSSLGDSIAYCIWLIRVSEVWEHANHFHSSPFPFPFAACFKPISSVPGKVLYPLS